MELECKETEYCRYLHGSNRSWIGSLDAVVHVRTVVLGNNCVLRVCLDQKVRWWTWRKFEGLLEVGLGLGYSSVEAGRQG